MFSLILAFMPFAPAVASPCHSPLGALVPDVQTARAIAVAVIAAHQKPNISKRYTLEIEEDGGDRWLAYQYMPPVVSASGEITVTMGGGGLSMRVDRCSGEITEVHFQR